MTTMYSFLICIAVAGIISGFGLIYTTLKYKDKFKNYKKELISDITMTIFPLLYLIILICTKTYWGLN